jgi:hypothetical protein
MRPLALTLVVLAALALAAALDAVARVAAFERTESVRVSGAALVGAPDLALSSSARWLRHPSQSEPGAAFSDAPAALDVDPADAVLGPPFELGSPRGPSRAPARPRGAR